MKGSACGCGVCGLSFSADTIVATPDGPRAIASINAGEKVLAYEPRTKEVTAQTVDQVFVNHDSDRIDVTLEAPAPSASRATDAMPTFGATARQINRSTETIHTTANHPWLTADRGWVDAGELQIGEPIQLANGSIARVDGVRGVAGIGAMYDLNLDKVHTFAVGRAAYVVHNCGDSGVAQRLRDRLGRFTEDPDKATAQPGDAVHGNSRASLRKAYLYIRRIDGDFEKWGVTDNPRGRYSGPFMRGRKLEVVLEGNRSDMLDIERALVALDPGPANFERWAGDNRLQ